MPDQTYAARKASRIDAMMADPRCAIVSLVKYCAERGYSLTLRTGDDAVDALCPPTMDPRDVLAAVWEVEAEVFFIVDTEGESDRRWAFLMWPGPNNCAPDESVADHGLCPMIDDWSESFHDAGYPE